MDTKPAAINIAREDIELETIFYETVKLAFLKVCELHGCENLISQPLSSIHSNITLEISNEQNNEVMIPIINVVAKPCIGPEPKMNRIKPVKKVLIWNRG
jgi:hypothetical protein